jgi:PKD repeat protein
MKIRTLAITLLIASLVLSSLTVCSMADVSKEPHNADAMWVEPSTITLNNVTGYVGMKFNVTVWLNMTENIFGYEIALHYNRAQLMCTRAKFTAGTTSNYFAGHYTEISGPVIDTSYLGNGSVLAFESCEASDYIPGPNNGSLIWAEFQILTVPSSGNFTSSFDITSEYPDNTWVKDPNLNLLSITTYNGAYTFIGPPPTTPPLLASIGASATSIYLNQSVLFTSTVSGGTGVYTLQWFENGSPVPGATMSTWNFTTSMTGSYIVFLNVTDSNGTTTVSSSITITVLPLPPLSATISASATSIYLNQSVLFTSTVSGGTGVYTLQWFENGSSVPGATMSTWNFTPGMVGSYTVFLNVTDSSGNTTVSNTITITVLPPLTGAKIYVDPSQIIDLAMGPGSTFSINITVANVESLSECVFNLTYDPQVLIWIGFDFLPVGSQYPTAILTGNTITGFAWISLYYSTPTVALSNPIARLRFLVNSYGISPFNLTDTVLLDASNNSITHNEFDGFFANIIRHVAVINVVPALSWLYQTWTDNINITVANLGNVTENFNVTALYNSTVIGTVPVTGLTPNSQTTVVIPWNTTGVPQGNYTITGEASFVPYETYFNTTNKVYTDGIVEVLTIIHQIAITAVTPTVAWAYVNSTVPINVTAADTGNATESFTVTAYSDGTAIGTLPVTNLAAGTSEVLTFYWDTAGITVEGNYTTSAIASTVPFEYNISMNYLVGGQVMILTQIRDVEIINVTAPRNWAYQGEITNITVTAENDGQVIESFNVTVSYDTILMGNVSVINLAPGANISEVFSLNTTGLTLYHNYTISGQASIVPFEFNTTNNYFADGTITVRLVGDVTGEGKVSGDDLIIIAAAFGSYGPGGPNFMYPGMPASPRWNPYADMNGDNKISGDDLILAAKNFGAFYP